MFQQKHELPTQNNKTLAEIPPLNAPVQMYLDCFLGFQCSSRIAGKVSLCCLISLTRNQCPKTIVKLKLINTCKLMSCCVSIMLQLSMYEQSINSENSNYVEKGVQFNELNRQEVTETIHFTYS
jgi:hypothetical protein